MRDIRNASTRLRGRRGILTLAATVAIVAFAAAPSSSWATVNESESAYQEPQYQTTGTATQVYSLQAIQTIVHMSGTVTDSRTFVTVNNNSMDDGATVDTWRGTSESEFPAADYLQANQLWEFIPALDNPGGTLQSGWGHLRNRRSGKCLQVMGASHQDAADVNQWACIPTADNELWKLVNGQSTNHKPKLMVKHSRAFLGVNGSNCGDGRTMTPDGDGQFLTAREKGTNGCATELNVQRAAYAFATNKIEVPLWLPQKDNASYACLPGYGMRPTHSNGNGMSYAALLGQNSPNIGILYKNISEYRTRPLSGSHSPITYENHENFDPNVPYKTKGQILIPCYPL